MAWDFFVGRGGQALILLMSYPVLRRAFMTGLERTPVDISLHTSMAMSGVSLSLLRDLCMGGTRKQLRPHARRWALNPDWVHVALVFACAYILLFPTAMSVATGYQSRLELYVPDPENDASLLNASAILMPTMIIWDAQRVGLQNASPVIFDVNATDFFSVAADCGSRVSSPVAVLSGKANAVLIRFQPS